MRLIDADALIDKKILLLDLRDDVRMFQDAVLLTDIINAPTIDAEPVKHGWWFKGIDGVYHCTRCGLEPLCWDDGTEVLSRHCPHCGTLMDGGNDE